MAMTVCRNAAIDRDRVPAATSELGRTPRKGKTRTFPKTRAEARIACEYDAFVPERVAGIEIAMTGEVAGVVSDAEKAIADLNRAAGPELMPLARLLLRTESIASSKVEGMQLDARSLARAEANQETGRKVGSGAAEILANIDAMQLSIERAADLEETTPTDVLDIHRVLMERAPNAHIAGTSDLANWIGGNDYNPCGAAFVPPPPAEVGPPRRSLRFVDVALPPLVQAAIAHAQFETIHPFADGNGDRRAWCRSSFDGAD